MTIDDLANMSISLYVHTKVPFVFDYMFKLTVEIGLSIACMEEVILCSK